MKKIIFAVLFAICSIVQAQTFTVENLGVLGTSTFATRPVFNGFTPYDTGNLTIGNYAIALPNTVSIMQSPYNAVCDGSTDDSAAINAAAVAAGNGGTVNFPSDKTCFFAATLIMQQNQTWQGGGPTSTILQRTGNFGDSIRCGSSSTFNCGAATIKNMWLNHSTTYNFSSSISITAASPAVVTWTAHNLAANEVVVFEAGTLPTGLTIGTTYYVVGSSITANTFQVSTTSGGSAINTSGSAGSGIGAGALANLATSGAHINAFEPQGLTIYNVWAWRMPYNIEIQGGALITIDDVKLKGLWDPLYSAFQEGIANIYLAYDATNGIAPTIVKIHKIYYAGSPSPLRTKSFTSTDGTTNLTRNEDIGSEYGIYSNGHEDLVIDDSYLGGAAVDNIHFERNTSAVMLDTRIANNFFDAAYRADIFINGEATTGSRGTTITGNDFNGELYGQNAIEVVNQGGVNTVDELSVTGNSMYAYNGDPIYITGAYLFNITGNTISSFNSSNIGILDPNWTSAIYIAGTTSTGRVGGNALCGNQTYTNNGAYVASTTSGVAQEPNVTTACTNVDINTGIGAGALPVHVSNSAGNTAYGAGALGSLSLTGSANTATGLNAGARVTTGTANALYGIASGSALTTGGGNAIYGDNCAPTVLTTGSGNILICSNAATVDTAASNTSNTLNIGNAITAVGLNTGTPAVTIPGTLAVVGNLTPSQTNGIVGTTTNNNANAGSVGEYVTSTGTAVSLTSATLMNVTSISLTAGDWEVSGSFSFNPAGSTIMQTEDAGISTTSVTLPAFPLLTFDNSAKAAGSSIGGAVPTQRISISSTTNVYLVAYGSFTVSTCTVTGNIRARRIR